MPIVRSAAVSDDPNTIQFAVCRRDTSALIGWIALSSISWSNRCAALGVYIGDPSAPGLGFGSAAYERLGFVLEGRRREYGERDGARYDLLVYGLLAAEWRQRQSR